MKLTVSIILIVLFLLILIKYNSNNLNFLSNNGNEEDDNNLSFFSLESFNNIPKDFICNKGETACIFVYQNYNQGHCNTLTIIYGSKTTS